TFKQLGFHNVHAEPVSVRHWERGDIRAELLGDKPQELVAVALGGSVGGNVTAPVVMVETVDDLAALPPEAVKGRIVFLNRRIVRTHDGSGYGDAVSIRVKGPAEAGRRGALGVVVRSVGTSRERIAHTGATRYDDAAPKVPAAALSNVDADLIEQQIKDGVPVKLRLHIGARELPRAQSANVVGEIPGQTDEIVLLGAHLDSWDLGPGANDDGAGVAIVTEAARLAAATGRTLRRTLRVVLFANEEHGLEGAKAYAKAHAAELGKYVLATEADFGSGAVLQLNAAVDAESWPSVAAIAEALQPVGVSLGKNVAHGGSDLGPMHERGVPVLDLRQDGELYFDVHHTVADTLENIDRAGLSASVAAFAATAYLAAEHAPGFGRTPDLEAPHVLGWKETAALPLPAAGEKIPYGTDPLQFGELRIPEGVGKFPVVELIHGGCWLSAFDYAYMTPLAEALRQAGYAVWTVEYRRAGDAGGGWPGTFQDVGAATDYLRTLAGRYPLDLKRVVAVGHSAGGQLALWLPTRGRLAEDSELHAAEPLALAGVVGLAAIPDLRSYAAGPEQSCHAGVAQVLGGLPAQVAERYAQVSPIERLPIGRPQILVQGALDTIVPPAGAHAYVKAARAAGERVRLVGINPAGHFEPVVPDGPAWEALRAGLAALVGK
ncbi:MAG TPA: M20/M25/M40 family metallo-hydrolase, partial [Candidatus Binatia bacterium]|nr:M20/M25/M40 family metallo-hydrolase [Candidatus Binatia bacterium]